ncbi:hypothetical protein [Methylobacterium frigidaeris]|uniref:Secreted protein n=1 Tax=Methylobacterium frigidaeris TaxID=2038277 RepID=A0AA37H8K8_9HYPH|nr:hypothetical protein [Methylobacterium frigidaeris]PIK74660.1 hypothetical protein CS379_01260 [Methylobacterium frigidaeris]GJD61362.1 hypothetical protein MPEAHAMD_1503 [Methylobacterium frigidaeris]
MSGRTGIYPAAMLGTLCLGGVASAGSPGPRDRTQQDLDAMTRHDLCARDDAGLKRLNRDLSKPSAAGVSAKR